ncbi:MAG: hypothetical protein M1828_004924 [Chrysothrix sp. TS-e1954]|nr:MAG: hypothetical protein M1828_004924 [Chrysothrix sp. TS-e1954]
MGNALSQSFFIPAPPLTEKNCPDQTNRVHLITGGYSGVGSHLASILYSKNATVYIAGRSASKADAAISSIKAAHPSSDGTISFLHIDLGDLASIAPAVKDFTSKVERLDVLTNNAGVMMPPAGSVDSQGHEMQMGTNCLGPFLLTKLLTPLLSRTAEQDPTADVRVLWAGSLVVDIGSPRPGGMKFESGDGADSQQHGDAHPPKSLGTQLDYGQSKVGNVYLCRESSRRSHLPPTTTSSTSSTNTTPSPKIKHISFNPGNLSTSLQRHLSWPEYLFALLVSHPGIYGAYTELNAALGKDVGDGDYVVPWGRVGRFRPDIEKEIMRGGEGMAGRFWEWCEGAVGGFV